MMPSTFSSGSSFFFTAADVVAVGVLESCANETFFTGGSSPSFAFPLSAEVTAVGEKYCGNGVGNWKK